MLATTAATTVRAADEQGRFAVKGPGLASCQDFVNHVQDKSQTFYVMGGWLLGFLSAHNLHMEETYDAASWQSGEVLLGLMENYCKQRPDERYAEAAIKLIRLLMPYRLTTESRLIRAENGEHRVAVYEEVMRRAQEALKAQGYYSGVVDGLYGPGSKTALSKFQEANKLPVTGVPDPRTMFAIFRDTLRAPQKKDDQ
ncbi:MAG: peptidoglycan-binding domain-containing protein [Alphaproteobacteria bacterium]